ncbi:hypothetical protein [Methanolobus psychrotolerans]|uniref:hypothetical protein n=1 Tax=Methanolobus psychrotolerans TaxID=1874706 RepID=UPI0013EDDF5D|nr:hypothetical protein [Methanolobus psychrotolerans]
MQNKISLNNSEIKFLNELFYRIDMGGGMTWIEELLKENKETYQKLCDKIST